MECYHRFYVPNPGDFSKKRRGDEDISRTLAALCSLSSQTRAGLGPKLPQAGRKERRLRVHRNPREVLFSTSCMALSTALGQQALGEEKRIARARPRKASINKFRSLNMAHRLNILGHTASVAFKGACIEHGITGLRATQSENSLARRQR